MYSGASTNQATEFEALLEVGIVGIVGTQVTGVDEVTARVTSTIPDMAFEDLLRSSTVSTIFEDLLQPGIVGTPGTFFEDLL